MNAQSYSSLNTYQRCPKQYWYKNIKDLQKKKRNVNLFRGISLHELAKVYFIATQEGSSTEDAWTSVENAAQVMIETASETLFEDELASAKSMVEDSLDILWRWLRGYTDDWTILHVEEEFITKLETGEVLSFTPDLVVQDEAGYVWIVDHKTTSRLPDTGIPFGDMQSLLYYSGLKGLYPSLQGFIFNRMRKKVPTKPRLTKTGKTRVANLANIDTTYEVLRDFIRDVAPGLMNDSSHLRRLAELRDGPNRFFWQETIYVNENTVDLILSDVSHVCSQISDSIKRNWYPRNLQEDGGYKSCKKCEFYPLCQADLLGWNTALILSEDYEARDPKNPYTAVGEDDGEN